MPKNTSVARVDAISRGVFVLADRFGVNIVGGDISRVNRLTIDVSMLGVVEKKNLVLRSGAKEGDVIFVSGKLGGSILGKHLKFTPRLREARFLVKNFKVNSMIDISDGLVQDLSHILKESNAGAVIYEELIPLSSKARNLEDALYRGEDFELLFTMPPCEAKKLHAKGTFNFRAVGEIVAKKYGLILVDRENRKKFIKAKGFCHF
jgi:thiamine-monophosphate kinase